MTSQRFVDSFMLIRFCSMHLVCRNSVEIVLPCAGALVKFNLLLQAMSFLFLIVSCSQSGSSSGSCKMETFIDQQFGIIGFGLISSHTSQCHMPSNVYCSKQRPRLDQLDSQPLLFYQASLCTAIFGTHKGFYCLGFVWHHCGDASKLPWLSNLPCMPTHQDDTNSSIFQGLCL